MSDWGENRSAPEKVFGYVSTKTWTYASVKTCKGSV